MQGRAALFAALIRTHHITSRKKVAKLKQAASNQHVSVLIRSGGSPGIMYVEGEQINVESWIDVVQRLRYKDYQLAARSVSLSDTKASIDTHPSLESGKLNEVDTVKDFAQIMDERGVLQWWRRSMGFPDRPAT